MIDGPLKIENFPTPQESKEKKKNTLEVKIGQNIYSLETESYNFEYPKDVQAETGIIGYERVIISSEKIKELYKKSNKDYNKKNDEGEAFGQHNFEYDFLMSLSNQEYPQKCFLHQFAAYASENNTKEYLKKFVEDKFFLQKIFDIDSIEELSKVIESKNSGTTEEVFKHHPEGYTQGENNFSVFEKKTKKFLKRVSPKQLPKFKEKIKNNEVFISSADSGLNVSFEHNTKTHNSGQITFSEYNILGNEPKFGFEVDSFFNSYLEKAISELRAINKENTLNPQVPFIDGINQEGGDFWGMILRMKNYNNEIDEFKETGILGGSPRQVSSQAFFKNLGNKYGGRFEEKLLENEVDIRGYRDQFRETRIPVFIGDDNVPQIRWGFAKYAHYTSEKGFNFFKIQHAENLPEKIEK